MADWSGAADPTPQATANPWSGATEHPAPTPPKKVSHPFNVRPAPIRSVGEYLAAPMSGLLPAAYEAIQNRSTEPLSVAGRYIIRNDPAGLNAHFDPYSDPSLKRAGVDPKSVSPMQRAVGELALQWYNPFNPAVGRSLGVIGHGIGDAFTQSRRASPFVDAAARAAGRAANAVAAPVGRVVHAVDAATLKPIEKGLGALFSRSAAAGLEKSPTYAPAMAAGEAYVNHQEEQQRKAAEDIWAGLTREQKREVAFRSIKPKPGSTAYVPNKTVPEPKGVVIPQYTVTHANGTVLYNGTDQTAAQAAHANTQGSTLTTVTPKGGKPGAMSLDQRAAAWRAMSEQLDAEQAAKGVRAPEKTYDPGEFFPENPRLIGANTIYKETPKPPGPTNQVPLGKIEAEHGRGKSRFSAAPVQAPQHKTGLIYDANKIADYHPDLDFGQLAVNHAAQARRAIANSDMLRELGTVPSIDPATGLQRTTDFPGLGTQPLNVAEPVYHGLPKNPTGPLVFGRGQAALKPEEQYIERVAQARAADEARQDPGIIAQAQALGISPAALGSRQIINRSPAGYRGRVAQGTKAEAAASSLVNRIGNTAMTRKAAIDAALLGATAGGVKQIHRAGQSLGDALAGVTSRANPARGQAEAETAWKLAIEARANERAAEQLEREATRLEKEGTPEAASEAARIRQAQNIARQQAEMERDSNPFWRVLRETTASGKSKSPWFSGWPRIVPTYISDGKAWRLAGEYADLEGTRWLENKSQKQLAAEYGNPAAHAGQQSNGSTLGEYTDALRREHGMESVPQSELEAQFLRHLAENPVPPSPAKYITQAREQVEAEHAAQQAAAVAPQTEEMRGAAGYHKTAAEEQRKLSAEQEAAAAKERADQKRAKTAKDELGGPIGSAVAGIESGTEGVAKGVSEARFQAHRGLDDAAAAAEKTRLLQEAENARLRAKVDQIERMSGLAEAFSKKKAARYKEIVQDVRAMVQREGRLVPEDYRLLSDLGLTQPEKDVAVDKPVFDWMASSQSLTPKETEKAKQLWDAFEAMNRMTRASIVLVPTVHAVNNLGMMYLASGDALGVRYLRAGDPIQLAKIYAGEYKAPPGIQQRAYESGAAGESNRNLFSTIDEAHAHETTSDADRAAMAAEKAPGVFKPLVAGATRVKLGAQHVYQGMNNWLFNTVENGIATDLFDRGVNSAAARSEVQRLTKAGHTPEAAQKMVDREVALEVRNTVSKAHDISPRERWLHLNKIFYFYPWMKTVIPFWVRKGIVDPKWWVAPERAIEVSNQAQGYDNPAKPFQATLGKRADGQWRLGTLPIPQRVLDPVSKLARIPFDVAGLPLGDKRWAQNVGEDVKAPVDYLASHLSLPGAIAEAATEAAGGAVTGHVPPWNMFAVDKNASPMQQAGQLGQRIAGRLISPIARIEDFANDPLGTAGSMLTGSFVWGHPTDQQNAATRKRTAAIAAAFHSRVVDLNKIIKNPNASDDAVRNAQNELDKIRALQAQAKARAVAPPPVAPTQVATPTAGDVWAGAK